MSRFNHTLRMGCLFLLVLTGCKESVDSSNASPGSEQFDKPNIVLVMTDDQGYGDMSMHGNPIVQTPHLETLASESVRLTNFHVDPTCSPTRAALMSGKYSLRAGVWHTVMGRHMLNNDHYILPEALRDNGYSTAMIGKWHLGENYPYRPQDQGFEHVLMHGGGGIGQSPDFWGNTQFDDWYYLNGHEKQYQGFATDVWFDEAIDYLTDASKADKPFFLYLATNAPHVPWRAPKQYLEPYKAMGLNDDLARFYGMITNIDDNIARLRQALVDAGVADNTIFIFMTDNGSVMAQKNNSEPLSMLSDDQIAAFEAATAKKIESLNYQMRGGKVSVYDGGHRVPFFIHWPKAGINSSRELSALTAHIDLYPTLLDLIGVDYSKIDTDGVSLAKAIEFGASIPDRTLFVTNQRVLDPDANRPYAVMHGHWRYVHADEDGGVELFDLSVDPGQRQDLSAKYPAKVAQYKAAYADWWRYVTGEGTPTTRIVVGSKHENPSRLTAMDWLAPNTDQVPWWPGFGNDEWGEGYGWLGNEERFQVSPWALYVAEAGNYEFRLYVHDAAAKKEINRSYAHLEIDGVKHSVQIPKGAVSVTFDLQLKRQNIDVRAWFDNTAEDQPKEVMPAFYMYTEKLGN